MDIGGSDFESFFSNVPNNEIDECHIITILYNTLCALNFIHTANIIHRDLTPCNLLVNKDC